MAGLYTDNQVKFLKLAFPLLRIPELTKAFNTVFGTDRSEGSIRGALKNRGITCGRKGFAKGERSLIFTGEQVKFIKENYPLLSAADLSAAINQKFDLATTGEQIKQFTTRHKIKSGRTGCFEKGHTPWNAGTKGKGVCKKNKGCFETGSIPANAKHIGAERVNKRDGFVLVKVAEKDPHTGAPTRYRAKHRVIWEQHNGPVPSGMVLRFIDGDKENCVVENLELLTRAEHLQLTRSGFGDAPKELKPTVLALAKLQTKIFERIRE